MIRRRLLALALLLLAWPAAAQQVPNPMSKDGANATLTLTNLWAIDRFGHERVSALAAPALASCGTSPTISGDDRAGEVTLGTGSPTTCSITFANAYTGVPYCNVTWQSNLALMQYGVAAAGISITQTAASSNKINYHCTARVGG